MAEEALAPGAEAEGAPQRSRKRGREEAEPPIATKPSGSKAKPPLSPASGKKLAGSEAEAQGEAWGGGLRGQSPVVTNATPPKAAADKPKKRRRP